MRCPMCRNPKCYTDSPQECFASLWERAVPVADVLAALGADREQREYLSMKDAARGRSVASKIAARASGA